MKKILVGKDDSITGNQEKEKEKQNEEDFPTVCHGNITHI